MVRRDLNYPTICIICGKEFMTQKYRLKSAKYCNQICYGKSKEGKPSATKGKHYNQGEKHHRWIKDRSKVKRQDRHDNPLYKEWRRKVLNRDNWTCQECGNKKNLHADHIKRYCLYPELRFELDNGRTLCIDCHKKTGTWGNIPKTLETAC